MSKERIQNRMLRYASGMLGVKELDMLDPIVRLYVESLSEEVSRIAREIENVEERMQEAIAKMVSSEIPISSLPAHCIIHVSPTEPQCTITKDTAFKLTSKTYLPKGLDSLDFYPAVSTDLHQGNVRHLVHDGLCYAVNNNLDKSLLARYQHSDTSQQHTCWIALSLAESITNLRNLSFYVDFVASEDSDCLSLLPFSHWRINGRKLSVTSGLHQHEGQQDDEKIALFDSFGVTNKLDNDILDYYQKHYITICDDISIEDADRQLPEALRLQLGEHTIQELDSSLIWLELRFPSAMPVDTLKTIKVSINTFPVSNKHLHRKSIELFATHPIVALETSADESFLAVDSITDSKAVAYFELPFPSFEDKTYGTYSVRTGGYERFNKRDTKEYLLSVAHKIDDSLPVIDDTKDDKDLMKRAILKVQELVNYLRKKQAEEKRLFEQQNYVLIDKLTTSSEVYFVKYWTSYCQLANGIKPNTSLLCPETSLAIDKANIFTIGATIGGKYPSFSKEKQKERSSAIAARTVLVSDDDIRQFCMQEFGGIIQDVTLRKGLEIKGKHTDLFEYTKDVLLTPRKNMTEQLTENDMEIVRQALIERSSASYNYRVRLKISN